MAKKQQSTRYLSQEHERLCKESSKLTRKAFAASSRARKAAWKRADGMAEGPEADTIRHGPVVTKAKTAAWEAARAAWEAVLSYDQAYQTNKDQGEKL